MKTINVTFTDEEYEVILAKKGETPWHDFILTKGGELNENLRKETTMEKGTDL